MSRLWWGALGLALFASRAHAQVPDSARADSIARDSTDYSELFLKTQEESRLRVAAVPRVGGTAILPALARMVFDRDTMDWHNSETLGDLLTKVPGVYLWRGGWVGRPEPANFQARGTASVEYYLDGFPFVPLGPDSLSIDPSLVPLSILSRVEVERLPGQLRVYLFTRRHDRLTPATRVGVSSGDFSTARYQGGLEYRFKNGLGFAVAGEHLAVPLASDIQGAYHNTQLWLQGSYVPSNKFSVMAQLIRGSPSRETVVNPDLLSDTLSQGLHGTRSDFQATMMYTPKGSPIGPRLGLMLGTSSWHEDSTELTLGAVPPHEHVHYVDQSVFQVGALAGFRTRTTSLEVLGWHRSRWTPLDVRATGGMSLTSFFTWSAEGAYQRHDGGRTSQWVTGRVGIRLPLGIVATGLARTGSIVADPVLPTDSARTQTDIAALASFDRPRFSVEGGLWRTDGFAPQSFPLYRQIPTIGATDPVKWVTVSARVAPRQWFILDGWYSNPIGSRPEGMPPTHSIINATIQSKFLRTFRSGIFGLKLQASMETWGTGVIGRDSTGTEIPLKGATFFRSLIELRLGDFIAYYDRVNLRASRLGYVPNLPLLRLASTFGVRWEFTN